MRLPAGPPGEGEAWRQIADAAAPLFASRPLAEVGVVEVAQAAGVSSSTVYHQFGTVSAVAACGWARLMPELAAISAAPLTGDEGPIVRMEQVLARFIELGWEHRGAVEGLVLEILAASGVDSGRVRPRDVTTAGGWERSLTGIGVGAGRYRWCTPRRAADARPARLTREEQTMSLTTTEGLTIADLEAMPDDGHRYELLGGSIVVNAAPAPRHQRASGALNDLLRRTCPSGHEVFYAPVDLDLHGGQRVEPDLVVAPSASVGDQRLSLPVLLVVELVSPSTALWDTVAKRAAYAESGIAHYWLVDTRKGQERFTALSLPSGAREYQVVAESEEEIDVHDPITVRVPLAALFEPAR